MNLPNSRRAGPATRSARESLTFFAQSELRAAAMPIRMLLEELCRAQDLALAKRGADKLEAHRQSVGKTAGDAGRGQAAKVSKAAERIGKGQLLIEVGGDLAGRHRQRG